jgi:hypothetical protein
MPHSSPSADAHSNLAWLAREFLITVALSFLCLLAIIQTVQYNARLSVVETLPCTEQSSSCTPCARISLHLAALSPLDILKVTTICAALVFVGMEAAARVLLRMGWLPASSPRAGDAEACVIEAPGKVWTDRKVDPIPRLGVISLSVRRRWSPPSFLPAD